MNLFQLQNTPQLGESISAPASGRESSGRGLYRAPVFRQSQQDKSQKLNNIINESFHQEEQYKQRQSQKNPIDFRLTKGDSKEQPQKKSLSDEGSFEEFKLQAEDKSSGRASFDNNLQDKFTLSKNTVFTAAESSNISNPSLLIHTDLWALSYTKANEKKDYFQKMISQSLQTALFLLLEWLPFIISLHFIGTSNNAATTGGYGMGIVWSNCFIEFIFGGLGLGLQILVTQAMQENKMTTAMNYFKKGIAIVTICMIPLAILMFLSGLIVEGISGNKVLGNYTYQYCTYGLPAFYFNGLYNILKGFFRAKKQGMLPLISIIFSAIASIFWNWVFIFHTHQESEVIGAALARNVTEGINVLILFSILYFKYRKEDKFSLRFSKLAFKGWTELTKYCLPIGGLLLLEWVGYELFTFQATHLSDSDFSAHVILSIFNTVYYQVAYGIAIAITSHVNQEMIGSNLVSSLRFSKLGIVIIFVFIFVTILPLSFLGGPFSRLFTSDQSAQESIQDSYGLFLTCLAMDAVLAGIVGITRGIGKQKTAAIIFSISFLLLGQILASIFTYFLDGGLVGIWLSILASIFIASFSQVIWTGFSDWEKSLIELQNFLQKEEKERKKMMYNRIKSRDSLIQYEQEQNTDEEADQTEQSQILSPTNKHERYNTNQVIPEKEENNSTINQGNNTFQMKIQSKNESSLTSQSKIASISPDQSIEKRLNENQKNKEQQDNINSQESKIREEKDDDSVENKEL